MNVRSYGAELRKLFRQQESLQRAFAKDIRKAREDGKSEIDIEALKYGEYFETLMLDEEIALLATANLTRKARRRLMPIPSLDTDGMWKQCNKISDRYVLTNQGISELRASLRKYRKEQAELVVMVLAALTGVIGVAIGLLAVIMK